MLHRHSVKSNIKIQEFRDGWAHL